MKYITNAIVLATVSVLAAACGGQPSGSGSDATSQDVEALKAELQSNFNAYAQAVSDRDLDLLTTLTSTEIHERANSIGMGMAGFAEKMRNSMFSTLTSMSDQAPVGNQFTIENVQVEGNAVRVEVAHNGENIGKPFYFVKEEGAYKLNLQRPGFSQPQPEGAGASTDAYRVRNEVNDTLRVSCSGGAYANIKPYADLKIGCESKCGFFAGTRFYSPLGDNSQSVKCDYNTWGVDAYYNPLKGIGVRCGDGC